MQINRWLALSVVPFAAAVAASDEDATKFEGVSPSAIHSRTSTIVVDQVRSNHLRRALVLDNAVASQVYDRYLTSLDRKKEYFLQSDIDEFEQHRHRFDEYLKHGDIDVPFEIFNRFMQRTLDRTQWIVERLNAGIENIDLETNEVLELNREDGPWFQSELEADRLWEKLLTSDIIRQKLQGKTFEDINELFDRRYKNQLKRVTQTNAEDAFSQFINAFTYVYDPHTNYMSPRRSDDFNMSIRLSLEGIGAVLRVEDDYVEIVELVPGGPADLQGTLKPTDKIVSVGQDHDGPLIDVVGWRIDEVVDLIRGPKGSIVVLEVLGDTTDVVTTQRVAITRDEVKLEDGAAKKQVIEVVHNGLSRKLGVIQIPRMYVDMDGERRNKPNYRSVTRDVQALIDELTEEGVEGLIVDLRGNGGGALREAHKLTGLFIPSGPTVQVRGVQEFQQVFHDLDGEMAWDGPLAVMVDRHSASASEIFSGAIQDYQRGVIVGNRTFGKGTVQTIMPLNHGALKVTQAKFYRVSGESTQNQGVVPDVEFPSLLDEEEIGESTIDGALPWDTIEAKNYEEFNDHAATLAAVRNSHHDRIRTNPHFVKFFAIEERIQEDREVTSIPLSETVRRQRKEDRDAWRLRIENDLFLALDKEPVATVDELDRRRLIEYQETRHQPDEFTIETGHILLDYIAFNDAFAQVALEELASN